MAVPWDPLPLGTGQGQALLCPPNSSSSSRLSRACSTGMMSLLRIILTLNAQPVLSVNTPQKGKMLLGMFSYPSVLKGKVFMSQGLPISALLPSPALLPVFNASLIHAQTETWEMWP